MIKISCIWTSTHIFVHSCYIYVHSSFFVVSIEKYVIRSCDIPIICTQIQNILFNEQHYYYCY